MARIFPLILLLILSSCLNAPRNNKFDPRNPDKITIYGTCVEFDSSSLNGVNVYLVLDENIIKTDTSDDDGDYELNEIDPGVYSVRAEAKYYKPTILDAETLTAGMDAVHYFLYNSLHFEDDPSGNPEPYSFQVKRGDWRIKDDMTQPAFHTTPHVYQGFYNDTAGYCLTVCAKTVQDFVAKTKLVVTTASSSDWQAGIVFHFQDIGNYYLLQFSADTIRFLKVAGGIQTELSSCSTSIPLGAWSDITVGSRYSMAFCYFNNTFQTAMIDNSFTQGFTGFWLSNRQPAEVTEINFDDLTFYPNISDTISH